MPARTPVTHCRAGRGDRTGVEGDDLAGPICRGRAVLGQQHTPTAGHGSAVLDEEDWPVSGGSPFARVTRSPRCPVRSDDELARPAQPPGQERPEDDDQLWSRAGRRTGRSGQAPRRSRPARSGRSRPGAGKPSSHRRPNHRPQARPRLQRHRPHPGGAATTATARPNPPPDRPRTRRQDGMQVHRVEQAQPHVTPRPASRFSGQQRAWTRRTGTDSARGPGSAGRRRRRPGR